MKNIQIASEIKLTYHPTMYPADRPVVTDSKSAYPHFLKAVDPGQMLLKEHFLLMCLDNRGGIIGISTLSVGNQKTAIVDIRVILATALLSLATSIIVAHNHPCGNAQPSDKDRNVTEKIAIAAILQNITLSDHLIFTPKTYFSMADHNML